MKRIVTAILFWACFLLISCNNQEFYQDYHHGNMKFTFNDTIIVPFTGTGYLSWKKMTDPVYAGHETYGDFSISSYQFDTTNVYHNVSTFKTDLVVQPHSFHQFYPGSEHFTVELYHPIIGGIYSADPGAVKVYFGEFNSGRINGYFYGDFTRYQDSTIAYVTCDFDFTP